MKDVLKVVKVAWNTSLNYFNLNLKQSYFQSSTRHAKSKFCALEDQGYVGTRTDLCPTLIKNP